MERCQGKNKGGWGEPETPCQAKATHLYREAGMRDWEYRCPRHLPQGGMAVALRGSALSEGGSVVQDAQQQ